MTAKLFIRLSAVLIFVHLLGHSIGHLNWDKPTDPGMVEVVTKMKSHSAEFMGSTKSMADYYQGYSLILFGLFGMSIIMLLTLSTYTLSNQKIVKILLYPIATGFVFFGLIEYLYFFPFAAIISTLAGLSTFIAITRIKN